MNNNTNGFTIEGCVKEGIKKDSDEEERSHTSYTMMMDRMLFKKIST